MRSQSGRLIYTRDNNTTGQQVWQSIGGMQQGSIWGQGGYLAPDWTADWLQREALALLGIISADGRFANETSETKDALRKAALSMEMRKRRTGIWSLSGHGGSGEPSAQQTAKVGPLKSTPHR